MADAPNLQAGYDERSRRLLAAPTRLRLWMLIPFVGFFAPVDRLFNSGDFSPWAMNQVNLLRAPSDRSRT